MTAKEVEHNCPKAYRFLQGWLIPFGKKDIRLTNPVIRRCETVGIYPVLEKSGKLWTLHANLDMLFTGSLKQCRIKATHKVIEKLEQVL